MSVPDPVLPSTWPDRTRSRLVDAAGVRWHVQQSGTGTPVLLVHGTGGSLHSWSEATAALHAASAAGTGAPCAVTAIDLPGHAFSRVDAAAEADARVYSLEGMGAALAGLLRVLGVTPTVVVGHSAGAAVLARMTLDGHLAPRTILGINPALVAPPELYLTLVAPVVGAIAETGFMADAAAWLARRTGILQTMLESTGSTLTPVMRERYATLCALPSHCHAALSMMSRWDLLSLVRDAARLATPLTLYAGAQDRWVPYSALAASAARIPAASLVRVEGAGHLLPEERPEIVVSAINAAVQAFGTAG